MSTSLLYYYQNTVELLDRLIRANLNSTSSTPQQQLAELSRAIPVLLNWGRRNSAFLCAQKIYSELETLSHAGPLDEVKWNWRTRYYIINGLAQNEIVDDRALHFLFWLCSPILEKRKFVNDFSWIFPSALRFAQVAKKNQKYAWEEQAMSFIAGLKPLFPPESDPLPYETCSACFDFYSQRTAYKLNTEAVASHVKILANGENSHGPLLSNQLNELACIFLLLDEGEQASELFRLSWNEFHRHLNESVEQNYLVENDDIFILDGVLTLLNTFTCILSYNFKKLFPIFLDNIDERDGRLHFVLSNIPSCKGKKILDLGCAKGRYINKLQEAKLPCSLYAQDLHDIFIPFMPSGLTTSCGSILRTGWTDGYFDGIFICEVLEHAIDVQMALQELNRILAIGGTLIIVDKNDSKLASWPGKLPEWEQWFNINKLNILLEEIGFSVEKIDQNVHYENGKNDNLFFGIVAIKIENCN